MGNLEKREPTPSHKKTRKSARGEGSTLNADPEPSKPSPTDRIEKAKNAHISLLNQERQRLLERVDHL